MKKALVTGATGFLGGHMTRRLLSEGWQVTATGRNEQAGRQLSAAGAQFLPIDLRNREQVVEACREQEYVFHCAALSSPWGSYRDFFASNVEATRHVADGCMQHGVQRLVHISTPSIYFDYRTRYGIRESDPLPRKPANHYAATKLLAEQLLLKAWEQQGLPVVMLRPRAIFGPMDQTLFPRLMEANRKSGVPLLNGGQAEIDLTYVDNVLDAMLLGASAPAHVLGQAYNISNGQAMPFDSLLTRLFEQLGLPLRTRTIPLKAAYTVAGLLEAAYRLLPLSGEPLLTRYTVGSIAVPHTLDIQKAWEELGYVPAVTVDEGLRRFADWWRQEHHPEYRMEN